MLIVKVKNYKYWFRSLRFDQTDFDRIKFSAFLLVKKSIDIYFANISLTKLTEETLKKQTDKDREEKTNKGSWSSG